MAAATAAGAASKAPKMDRAEIKRRMLERKAAAAASRKAGGGVAVNNNNKAALSSSSSSGDGRRGGGGQRKRAVAAVVSAGGVPRAPGLGGSSSGSEASSESSSSSDSSESSFIDAVPLLKPVFVTKAQRETFGDKKKIEASTERAAKWAKKREKERKKQSRNLVRDIVQAEIQAEEERAAAGDESDVSSSDETKVDMEAEKKAWRKRELARVKRERDERLEAFREEAERERRRGMTDAEIMAEDAERNAEAEKKGSMQFLTKYYHKGAFYQDVPEDKKHLFQRDYSQVGRRSFGFFVLFRGADGVVVDCLASREPPTRTHAYSHTCTHTHTHARARRRRVTTPTWTRASCPR